MKRTLSLILAVACIFATLAFAVSCGEEFNATEWSEDNEKTKRSASFKNLSDEKYYEIDVDGKINMSINVTTVSGDAFFVEIYNVKTQKAPIYTLVIYKNADGELVYNVNYGGEELKEIPVTGGVYAQNIAIAGDDDEFVIHIKGQNHTGSFVFDW